MSNQIRQKYDIIINGGGIVGFTLLNSILKSPLLNGLKVLLIEHGRKPESLVQPARVSRASQAESDHQSTTDQVNFSNRVSSITKSSRSALEQLGVWEQLHEFAKDVTDIKVWNYDYTHRIAFQQNQCCNTKSSRGELSDVIFSVVENNRLSLALLDRISNHTNQSNEPPIAWNSSLQNMSSHDGNMVNIKFADNESGSEMEACASLILGCDGFKSKVRELSNMKYLERDLNKTAVVGTVRMESRSQDSSNLNTVAYQRFSSAKDTVAALLPLDQQHSSFVISAPTSYATYLKDCDEVAFINEFNRLLTESESPNNPLLNVLHSMANSADDALRNLLNSANLYKSNIGSDTSPAVEQVPRLESSIEGSRAMFPLYFGTTTPKMTAKLPGGKYPQIALLGDSSHRVHPLAGQGLNLGIQDAVELVRQLESIAKCGEKLFDEKDRSALCKALTRYELKRQAYIMPMSAGILAMPNLFKLMPSRMVSSINRCPFIKSTSVAVANGC